MIRNTLEAGSTVYFLDDRNFLRRGELLSIAGAAAGIKSALTILSVPAVRCFEHEADALRKRVEILTGDITARQQALAETFKRLAELSEPLEIELDGDTCCSPCLCNCSGAPCCQS